MKHKLSSIDENSRTAYCSACNESVEIVVKRAGVWQCGPSRRARTGAYREKQRAANPPEPRECASPECSEMFVGRKDRRYCSEECYPKRVRADKRKRKERRAEVTKARSVRKQQSFVPPMPGPEIDQVEIEGQWLKFYIGGKVVEIHRLLSPQPPFSVMLELEPDWEDENE